MRLKALDGLRGVAVLAVVAYHLAPSSVFPFAFGTRGVDLFFVISGFCLSLPALRRLHAGDPVAFDLRRFASDRFWRIVPPYWVAITLFGILSVTAFGVPSVTNFSSPGELARDASVFFTGLKPAYNPSFWTLGIEARWYVFFPALLFLYIRSKSAFGLTALALYACYATRYRIPDMGTLPCFMLGIVAADLAIRGHARYLFWVPAALGALALACLADPSGDHGDPLWHAAAFLIVLAGVGAGSRLMSWRPLVFVGVASYSIYLVHQPVMAWLTHNGLPTAVAAIVAVGFGLLFWAGVETSALKIRERMRKGRSPLEPRLQSA